MPVDHGPASDWRLFDFTGTATWPELWPPVPYRPTSATMIEFRLFPPDIALNRLGGLHGAFLAGLAENCFGLFVYENPKLACVTVSLSLDYPAAGQGGIEIQGELELMRETGRMQFLRIMLRQGEAILLHGTGVLRKLVQQ